MATCQAVVTRCSDYRLETVEKAIHYILSLETMDRVYWPGAGMLNAPRLATDVQVLVQLHAPADYSMTVVVTGHEDCGVGGTREGLKVSLAQVRAGLAWYEDWGISEEPLVIGFWIFKAQTGQNWGGWGLELVQTPVQDLVFAAASLACRAHRCKSTNWLCQVLSQIRGVEPTAVSTALDQLAGEGKLECEASRGVWHVPGCTHMGV